jgi:hypothetical protein
VLALASGIPMDTWAAAGEQAIVTALQLLDEAAAANRSDRDDGPRMSG